MNHKPTDSPALKHQSEIYPANYRGRVPLKIRMAKTVYPDLPFLCKRKDTVATVDEVYECWVNSHGAVAAICRNGETLGVKPGEFDVIEWHGEICGIKVVELPCRVLRQGLIACYFPKICPDPTFDPKKHCVVLREKE